MRLIDADKLADALFEQRKNYPQWVADTIGNMPEAIVRCKDCKHRSDKTYTHGTTGEEVYVCQVNDIAKQPNWFCADGERR